LTYKSLKKLSGQTGPKLSKKIFYKKKIVKKGKKEDAYESKMSNTSFQIL